MVIVLMSRGWIVVGRGFVNVKDLHGCGLNSVAAAVYGYDLMIGYG